MDHLTTAQIAERYRCSTRTVHRLIADGDLAYLAKLPGKTGAYLFDAAEVERAFATRTKGVAA